MSAPRTSAGPASAPRVLRAALASLLFASSAGCASAHGSTATIRLVHFSDYHSHAVPRPAAAGETEGGLARFLAFAAPLRREGAVVLSGGDLLSRGAPSWSDRHGCAEWPWLDGVVDATAFGNHDADYGAGAFARCRGSVRYPVLCANLVDASGRPLLDPYAVLERSGVRIGVFAVAGPDFPALLKESTLPFPGARFEDPVEAARRVVGRLRDEERVAAVVLIGHEHHADDIELARRVPGIDLILGSHSHLVLPMETIPGTATRTISGGAYLAYASLVALDVRGGKLAAIRGELVPMSGRPEDPVIRERVSRMQAELEDDPVYAPLFRPFATLAAPLGVEGGLAGDSPLGRFVTFAMRRAAGADVAVTTASSLREPLPAGPVVEEQLRAALPYPNALLVCRMSGARLLTLLAAGVSRTGSDLTLLSSGLRWRVEEGRPVDVVLTGPAGDAPSERPLDPASLYEVALPDFVARTAEPYRSILQGLEPTETGFAVRDVVRSALAGEAPR